MKKIILLCTLVIFLTGCTSINTSSIDSILNETLSSTLKITNTQRNGYSYYLPRGLILKNTKSFNEKLEDDLYQYYLYVDVVSYNNKTKFKYTLNNKAYFSSSLENNGKFGYVEINNYKNNQYLIEIMYNYAKIEVMVFQEDIKEIVTYVMSIISSITYNDNVIKNTLSSSRLDEFEESFNIFEIVGSDNYLQFSEEVVTDDRVKDPDYVN